MSNIRQGLKLLASLLDDPQQPRLETGDNEDDTKDNSSSSLSSSTGIRIPYLYLETLDVFPIIDRYYALQ
jgi:hypothetical protein